mmetsp:Transcript_16744/g.19129  ORF Transcript_16744/g.19129 Transcript_16744/m.19129 type:complete len:414 (-) Transcript_16744:171-1412(-)
MRPIMTSRLLYCAALMASTLSVNAFTIKTYHSYPLSVKTMRSRSLEMSTANMPGELTSALARIDRERQLTTRSSNRPTSGKAGWTKLLLNPKESKGSSTEGEIQQQQEFVYLLEPSTTPSSLILFLGGAGLGQFPHIAYDEFLSRLSQKLNAAVITAPFPLSLDHYDLSKKATDNLRRAVVQCEEMADYSPSLPKFYIGHSLGSKLLTISLCATGIAQDLQGIGFLSYNNFGFADTIKMVKSFASQMDTDKKDFGQQDDMINKIFEFAEGAVNMSGLDFVPSPTDTDTIVSNKFTEDFQNRTRLFIFDDDDLDSSIGFMNACRGSKPSVSYTAGNHLTPVYLKLGLDDLKVPDEAKELTDELTGGFKSASFGDEENLNEIVNDVYNWIIGKDPSRDNPKQSTLSSQFRLSENK